jgi:ABC-type antimicrobial peptide transport system permease subunit
MTAYVDDVLAPRRASVATLLSFAAVAFVLATIGVYSVIAYTVEQRRRELGVRLALGASREDVARHVMAPAILMSALGILLGVGGAVATRKLVAGLLFGVTATDPVVIMLVTTLVLMTGTLAAAIPALRATRIDPAIALNSE